jgi:adenylate kinase family enzyme
MTERRIKNYPHERIFILGDSGRGKSTFARKLSEKIAIPYYSTDDFFWKTKFSEPSDRQKSIEDISRVYDGDSWIVEGGIASFDFEGPRTGGHHLPFGIQKHAASILFSDPAQPGAQKRKLHRFVSSAEAYHPQTVR